MKKCFFITVSIFLVMGFNACAAGDEKNPEYFCRKVPENSIKVDGRLDDPGWTDKPGISLLDMCNASLPRYPVNARIVWDDNFIYVGWRISDPQIAGVVTATCARPAGDEKIVLKENESVVEFFIDPDGDGMNYIEVHVNSHAELADLLINYPRDPDARKCSGIDPKLRSKYDYSWNCKGIRAAVAADPNNKGWSAELAIPWASVGTFIKDTKKNTCKILVVHHRKLAGAVFWWSWPVMQVENCHFPSRWGIIRFQNMKKQYAMRLMIENHSYEKSCYGFE